MKICDNPNCREENPSVAKYCRRCGKQFQSNEEPACEIVKFEVSLTSDKKLKFVWSALNANKVYLNNHDVTHCENYCLPISQNQNFILKASNGSSQSEKHIFVHIKTFKFYNNLFLTLTLVLSFVCSLLLYHACNSPEVSVNKLGASYLKVDGNTDMRELALNSEGGSYSFNIDTNLKDYVVKDVPDWAKVTKNGNRLLLEYTKNMDIKRSACLSLENGEVKFPILLVQNAMQTVLLVNNSIAPHAVIKPEGEVVEFQLNTNADDYRIINRLSWVTVKNHKTESFSLIFSPNRTSAKREGSVLISSGNVKVYINLEQQSIRQTIYQSETEQTRGQYLRVNGRNRLEKQVSHEGGTSTFNVSTNADNYIVKNVPGWCTIDQFKNKFVIHVNPNQSVERNGTIYVQSDKNTVEIRLKQDGQPRFLTVNGSQHPISRVKANQPSLEFSVQTSAQRYRVENLPSWATVNFKRDDRFVLKLEQNKSLNSRECVFYVVDDSGLQIPVKLIQERTNDDVSSIGVRPFMSRYCSKPNLIFSLNNKRRNKTGISVRVNFETAGLQQKECFCILRVYDLEGYRLIGKLKKPIANTGSDESLVFSERFTPSNTQRFMNLQMFCDKDLFDVPSGGQDYVMQCEIYFKSSYANERVAASDRYKITLRN